MVFNFYKMIDLDSRLKDCGNDDPEPSAWHVLL